MRAGKNMLKMGASLACVAFTVSTLAGCSDDKLVAAANSTADTGYVAGDGSTTSFAADKRTDPVEFQGETETGDTVSSADIAGNVTVVNFWYAGCAPCRAEAKDLNAVYEEFAAEGVQFLGVNTRDQVAQAAQFTKEFAVQYPSILDAPAGRTVQAAFAGQVPLNAVPTTLVLDREGRVAHRVLGQLAAKSQLATLIKETLAEK